MTTLAHHVNVKLALNLSVAATGLGGEAVEQGLVQCLELLLLD